jgi:hypothetical protein
MQKLRMRQFKYIMTVQRLANVRLRLPVGNCPVRDLFAVDEFLAPSNHHDAVLLAQGHIE